MTGCLGDYYGTTALVGLTFYWGTRESCMGGRS